MWDRKHFLTIYDLSRDDVIKVVDRGLDLKGKHHKGSLPWSSESRAFERA